MRWWNPCVDGPRSFKISGPWHVCRTLYTQRTKKGNAKFISMSIKPLFHDFQTASQIHPTKELICGKCTITVSCIFFSLRCSHTGLTIAYDHFATCIRPAACDKRRQSQTISRLVLETVNCHTNKIGCGEGFDDLRAWSKAWRCSRW